MTTIWKFQLTPLGELEMPVGAKILSVQMQHDVACLWAEVDPGAEHEARRFCIHGTGHEIDHKHGPFIGTFQMDGGSLVFHVFERQRHRLPI